jgi:hypothetical protein
MNADDVMRVLEKNWPEIREHLGEGWDQFLDTYEGIVVQLPRDPSQREVEQAVDGICSLMKRHDYTRALLQRAGSGAWSGGERLQRPGGSVNPDRTPLDQIRQRMGDWLKEADTDRQAGNGTEAPGGRSEEPRRPSSRSD